MDQFQAFIEKAKNDSGLMAKLDELGANDAKTDEIIKIAAEYGFTLTAADVDELRNTVKKGAELSEEELNGVSGGLPASGLTENRYDTTECAKIKEVQYRCVGFLAQFNCDHYRKHELKDGRFIQICDMGCFYYYVDK